MIDLEVPSIDEATTLLHWGAEALISDIINRALSEIDSTSGNITLDIITLDRDKLSYPTPKLQIIDN